MSSRRLNPQIVLDTAAELANARGSVADVSLTALAEALGVRVPSLYNHVAGLDGLRADLRRRAQQEQLQAAREAAAGRSGIEALHAMGLAYRRFAHEQPGLYPLTIIAPDPDDTAGQALSAEWLTLLARITAGLGLHGEEALHAIRGYRAVLHGYVSLETAGGYKLDLDRDASFERLLDVFLGGLARFSVAAPVQTAK